MKMSWRLIELLKSRRGGSLQVEPWPVTCDCIVLKSFTHAGRRLQPENRLKAIPPDVVELPAAEARTLLSQGIVDPRPRADRVHCSYAGSPESWPGWIPWQLLTVPGEANWNQGKVDNEFDETLVRVRVIKGSQICPGVIPSPRNILYLPFIYVRTAAGGGFYTEDERPRDASYMIFLDEFAPAQQSRVEVAV
jgi:hypothetical protein